MSKVLNWYHLGRKIPKGTVYIGRGNRHMGLPQSILANPFKMSDYNNDRDKVISLYRDWLYEELKSGRIPLDEIYSIYGQNVMCFCAPKPCHGDVVLEVLAKLMDKSNKEFRFNWSRKEGYQVNSKGDAKFSAFNAIMHDGRSIEQHYQCDVKGYEPGGTDWKKGKGKKSLRNVDLFTEYLKLWRRWARRNKDLMDFLHNRVTMHKYLIGDFFATTEVNQAHALSIILNERYLGYKRVIVAGTRDFTNYDLAKEYLDNLNIPISTIVCGEASGADTLGRMYGEEKGIVVESYPAQWDKYEKSAGYIRNTEMAKNADHLVAFWNGTSKGTKHMLDIAKQKNIPTTLIMV